MQARMTKAAARSRGTDADAAWRYRFRQKWRREQLRALMGELHRQYYGSKVMQNKFATGYRHCCHQKWRRNCAP